MKIILSVEPIRFPLTGIGRYTFELASALSGHSDISDLRFFSSRKFLNQLPQASNQPGHHHQMKQWIQKSNLASEIFRRVMPEFKRWALRQYKDFLYHGPNFFLPPFSGPKIATFHDLSSFTWAECNTPQRIRYAQKESLKTLQSADALIVDSDYIRQELADYFNWPIARIHSVPLACSPEFKPRPESECYSLLRQLNLNYQQYTLYVGTIEPRKNLIALLDAYQRLPKQMKRRYPLILAGYQGWKNDDIMQKISLAERQGWARYLGFLPSEYLPQLFSAAKAFCFPSFYEGFGLPVLEAMASGIPVVSSNSSSLPEITGDAALTCFPEDIETLTHHLERVLSDNEWRSFSIQQGLNRATHYSWSRCAEQTITAYRSVLGTL